MGRIAGRIGWMLVGALIVLAARTTTAAEDRALETYYVSIGDCSQGSVEFRLNCLSWQLTQIKRRPDGEVGLIVPLAPQEAPAPHSVTPRLMPPRPPLPPRSSPPAQPQPE